VVHRSCNTDSYMGLNQLEHPVSTLACNFGGTLYVAG
jgi:hypothetical protein